MSCFFRFKSTYYYESQGETGIQGSKDAIRLAFKRELIKNGETWMDMIQSRIQTAHTYNEETAREVVDAITEKYFGEFQEFKSTMSELDGSRAKGTHKNGSDIDVTLRGDNLNLTLLNQIRSRLDDLSLPQTFDLSIFSQIDNEALLDHIARVGKPLYKKAADPT